MPSTEPKARRHADIRESSNGQARQRQLLLDLAQRADEGIVIHLPAWLLIGWSTGPAVANPVFYGLNAALFGVNLLARLALRRHFRALVERDLARARVAYLVPLIGNALHWGVLAAAAVGWQPLADSREALWFTTIAVAASGTMSLSIMPSVRLLYPVASLLPVTAAMLWDLHGLSSFYPVGLMVLFAYMFRASGAVQRDYRCAADLRAELEERARELERLSTIDSLTGIRNRHYFDHRLVNEWTTAARERQPLTVLMIDVDHFKLINDTHGHAFGDRCLQAIARTLEATLRHPNDTLARYGGEEFAALLPDTSEPAAYAVAERMRQQVAAIGLSHDGVSVALACSIGLFTVLPQPREIATKAVEAADRALYRAKAQGRNRVVVAETSHGQDRRPSASTLRP